MLSDTNTNFSGFLESFFTNRAATGELLGLCVHPDTTKCFLNLMEYEYLASARQSLQLSSKHMRPASSQHPLYYPPLKVIFKAQVIGCQSLL